ncbi:uncharacterized protein KY384_007402 [Bacidia gigantensis]|uniref:uncharacterized protein n=1 Tax=Bacidia gigantensis TaxID=2732470 RepID=UPI001D04DE60|nr:uncharacterized protein KY384_007402 [Bacidia gigantensis]KAG8528484.1 hypothetical protein KY384_007402 [Bacidia gigantensis]
MANINFVLQPSPTIPQKLLTNIHDVVYNHNASSLLPLSVRSIIHLVSSSNRLIRYPKIFTESLIHRTFQIHSPTMPTDARPVIFFDIDNCLYPRSARVQEHMAATIDLYFQKHLSLSSADATLLHTKYYTDYGLAISGLVKHHKIDPMAYNREVDDTLPMDQLIKPDPGLRRLLEGLDKEKVKLWLFTNAYITHAKRVIKILGLESVFEGITYCDYAQVPLVAKPHREMFEKAEREAGVSVGDGRRGDCYFVDDSALNCRFATEWGWTVVHKMEEGDPLPKQPVAKYQVTDLEKLRECFPQFFKSSEAEGKNIGREGHMNGSSL